MSSGQILRNGVDTGGVGSQLLWYGGVIYTLGDDSNWWRWTNGMGVPQCHQSERRSGAAMAVSAFSERRPLAQRNADASLVQHRGQRSRGLDSRTQPAASAERIELRRSGFAAPLVWGGVRLGAGRPLVALDRRDWVFHGANDPSGGAQSPPSQSGGTSGASPSGARTPPSSSIVDNALAVWTVGANQQLLRNDRTLAEQVRSFSGIAESSTPWGWMPSGGAGRAETGCITAPTIRAAERYARPLVGECSNRSDLARHRMLTAGRLSILTSVSGAPRRRNDVYSDGQLS